MGDPALDTVALAVASGLILSALATALRQPSLLFLLLGGFLLGPDGVGWLRPESLGRGLGLLIEFGVAVVLFEGGLSLRARSFRMAPRAIRNLVLYGIPITWGCSTLAAGTIGGLPWKTAGLFGVLVSVTGPTVIGPLLRRVRATPAVETLLRWESIWADCLGVTLTVVYFEYLLLEKTTLAATGAALGSRILLGAAIGGAIGVFFGWDLIPLAVRRFRHEGTPALLALGSAFLAFGVAERVEPEAGIVAVTVAGFVLGSKEIPGLEEIREFKDRLTVTFVSLLFVLLSATVPLSEIRSVLPEGFVVVALLLFVVRPLAVAAGTRRSTLSLRERIFVSLIAPRGIVAASFAAFVAQVLLERGDPSGTPLRALVFLTIAVSVAIASLFGGALARLLGLGVAPHDPAVLIAGSHALARAIGVWWSLRGGVVRLLDTDAAGCARARALGLDVRFADPTDASELRDAREHAFDLLLVMTRSEARNARVAEVALPIFPSGRIFVFGSGGGTAAAAAKALGTPLLGSGWSLDKVVRGLEEGRLRWTERSGESAETESVDFAPLLAIDGREWRPPEKRSPSSVLVGLLAADGDPEARRKERALAAVAPAAPSVGSP